MSVTIDKESRMQSVIREHERDGSLPKVPLSNKNGIENYSYDMHSNE